MGRNPEYLRTTHLLIDLSLLHTPEVAHVLTKY